MDIAQLRESIKGFSFEDGPRGNQGYKRVLLQLFGYAGHGKSSFINSCKYVLSDGEEFRAEAEAADGADHHGGHTTIRKAYPLTHNITMVDNRGCSTMNDFEIAEVYAQLGNFIRIDKEVKWKDNFKTLMEEIINSDGETDLSDFIVPMFIYSVKNHVQEKSMTEITTFMDNCVRMTGCVPIVVLTHKTSGDYLEVEKKFRRMGAEMVIAIENYSKERTIKTLGRTTDILTAIDCALRNVRFRMEQPRDPMRERRTRMKFLLDFIHHTEAKANEQKRIKDEENRQKEKEKKGICVLL